MIRAIIFDLDGTLVDTTSHYLATYLAILRKDLGLQPDEDMVRRKFGMRATEIMISVLEEMGIDRSKIDIDALVNRIRDEFIRRVKDVTILPGVLKLLESLKGRYRLGLATSSRPYAACNILKQFGLEQYFDTVVTGNDVKMAKPNPEMFLLVAKKLGVRPEECLVVEDAVYGVEAAHAAGMKVVAVATGACNKEELKAAKPDYLLNTLEEFGEDILNQCSKVNGASQNNAS